jgi:hypothetical protein
MQRIGRGRVPLTHLPTWFSKVGKILMSQPWRLQTISSCIGWGPRPTWNNSQIHFTCKQGAWEHLYAVDGWMDPPSWCHFHHICPSQFYILCSWLNSHDTDWLLMTSRCIFEAPDPHGMLPMSNPSISKMLENSHMLWMGGLIHHHAAITTFCLSQFSELVKFPWS